jgi:hypothetical protein
MPAEAIRPQRRFEFIFSPASFIANKNILPKDDFKVKKYADFGSVNFFV